MRKFLKWFSITIFAFLMLWLAAGLFLVLYVAPKTDLKKIVEDAIDDKITSKAKVERIDFRFFTSFPNVSLNINNFLIYDSISMDTIISVEKAEVDLSTIGLLENRISVRDITIIKPYINYYVDSLGNNNLDSLVKVSETRSQMDNPVINLHNMSIREGRVDYHELSTGQVGNYSGLNFDFQGKINLKDSVLDVRHGDLFVGKNSLTFRGHADPDYMDFTVSHNLDNLNSIAYVTSIEQLEETDIRGSFSGLCHINGKLGSTFDSISVSGYANGKNISINSSKNSIIVTNGEFSSRFRLIKGLPDSSFLSIDTLVLKGEDLSLATSGMLAIRDSDLFIDARVKTNGNLTELVNKTSLLPKSKTLQGKIKADIAVVSSLYDLKHKYKFPKSLKKLYDLDIKIEMPDVKGSIDISKFRYVNDTLQLKADNINLAVDGKHSLFFTKFDNLLLSRNGKVENTSIKIQKGCLNVDGKKSTAAVKINEAGFLDVVKAKDSVIVLTHLIDVELKGKNKEYAKGWFENFSYRRGDKQLFGAKVSGTLSKSSKKLGKPWDTGELEVYITRFQENNLDLFCKRATGTFRYDGKLSGLVSNADSIHFTAADNELYLKGVKIQAESNDSYRLISKTANTERVVLGMGISINNLNALYHMKTKVIDVKTGRMTAGTSDFSAAGIIDVSKKMPMLDVNLVGKHLNINEMIVAGNRMNLAMGNPNAIPLDSIPPGKLPRSGGKIGKNMSIGLNLERLTLTSLQVSNVTGEILMRDKATLINNLRASGKGYNLCLNTKYTFVDRGFSVTDIFLDFKDLEISELPNVAPSLSDVTPMLSALKGTVNLEVVLSTPVRYFIGINMKESKATAKLEAKNLSITNNETFKNIAKSLMFKDREHVQIDSLAVAATIKNAQLKLYPFMLKVDRYKVGMNGENDIITKQINYHLCVLKSPVPFKFGIDITGIPKYKIKLVKSGYKQLNPDIKPWTDPEFEQMRQTLIKPIDDFRNSIKR